MAGTKNYLNSMYSNGPAWPLMVKNVSMLVQGCSGGTLFSDMFGTEQPFFSEK